MKTTGAILVFVAVTVLSAVGLAFPLGGISPQLAWMAFVLGFAAAIFAWRGIRPRSLRRPSAWDILMLVIFALVSLRAFLWLIYATGDEWKVLSPNNLGDMSFHLHLIRYLAGGADFWPTSPILAGSQLTYPLGADLFNALLNCAGVPVEKGLLWTALVGAGLTGWALWRWSGAFGIAALLFNGGLAGFLIFKTGHVSDFQAEIAWKNFFLTMLVTQRGLLYALPCGLFLLSMWREDFFGRGSGVPRWIALLLYATLPLFSVHAFLFLSLVLAAAFLTVPAQRTFLLLFVACALVPATLALFFVTGHFASASGVRWLPGWMQGKDGWFFWVWNFGFSLPLLVYLAWKVIRYRQREAVCFAGTGLFVFILCSFVCFAPWEWDNTKLFIWAWLACAPFLWEMISKWRIPVRTVVCFALFFSGAVSLIGGIDGRHGYKIASRSELAETASLLSGVPLQDTIALEPDYNHPVMLLGRPVLCGYEGHLWSHGLNYRKQWDELQTVLQRKPGWKEALARLDAQWLYLKRQPPLLIKIQKPGESIPASH